MTVLDVANLSVSYGGIGAVHDVSLQVGAGQIVTVIGPNGAGKTTLLNAIMGVHPGRGAVRFAGRDVARLGIEDRVRAGMCLVPEKRELFGAMTVEDNLRLGGFRLRGAGASAARAAMDDVYALFPRLRERRRQEAGTLSGGERQMLAMGRALMARPDLLLLDEPSLGLAPLIVREIFRIIAGLRSRGCAILLVEQNARAALQVSDHAYVLETGQVVLQGPSTTLAGDARIVATYLGAGTEAAGSATVAVLPTSRTDRRLNGDSGMQQLLE
ncbi:MAG TPA: ABC transporter ATP-binding protein [Acetobacteraceae bacterium]